MKKIIFLLFIFILLFISITYSTDLSFNDCQTGSLCSSGQIVKNTNSGWMEYVNNYYSTGDFVGWFDLFSHEDYQNVPAFAVSWRDIESTEIANVNETAWKNQIKNSRLGKAIDRYFYNPPNGKKPKQILLHVNVNFDSSQKKVNWRGQQVESGSPQWFIDKLSNENNNPLVLDRPNKYIEIPFYSDTYKNYIERLYYRISKTYNCDTGKAGDCPIFAIRNSGTGYFGEEVYVEELHSLLTSNSILKEKFKTNKLAFADNLATYFPKQKILLTPYLAECTKNANYGPLYNNSFYGPKNEAEYEAYFYSNAYNELVDKGWAFERDSSGNLGAWNQAAGFSEYLKSDITQDIYAGSFNPSSQSCWKDYSTVSYFKNNDKSQEILKGPVVIETGGQHLVFGYGMTPEDQTVMYAAAGDVLFQIEMAKVNPPFSEQTFWLKQGLTWHPNAIQGPTDVMFNYPFWSWVNGWVNPNDSSWWNSERRARIDNSELISFFPQVANKLGPHIFLDSLNYTTNGQTINYTANWRNKGVGQIFDDYELVFNVRNNSNKIVYTGTDSTFDSKEIPPGTYKVKLNNNQGGFIDSTYVHTGTVQLQNTQEQDSSDMKLTIELKYKEAGIINESLAIENIVPSNNNLETREYQIQTINEICDHQDNDFDNQTDEGCDDDYDHFADSSMTCTGDFWGLDYVANPAYTSGWHDGWFYYEGGWRGKTFSCATNSQDPDDTNPSIYPGAVQQNSICSQYPNDRFSSTEFNTHITEWRAGNHSLLEILRRAKIWKHCN